MKGYKALVGACGFSLLAGCGSGGIVFNGVQQVEQFPIRKTPIVHLPLTGETPLAPGSSVYEMDWSKLPSDVLGFAVQGFPGHDWWTMDILSAVAGNGICTDNPTCRTIAEVRDWPFTLDNQKPPGPGWPNPNVNTGPGGQPARLYIGAWVISTQNQWFLRMPNGAAVASPAPGEAPISYESFTFSSMRISLHEVGVTTVPADFSPTFLSNPRIAAQQEVGDPLTVGTNGVQRISVPVNNVVSYGYNGAGAPEGLMATGWREPPAQNLHIESSVAALPSTNILMRLVGVPVPDYFGGGGPITCGGGVFHRRFLQNWLDTTSGTSSTISVNDGVRYSYYLAAIGNHIVGYGLGLLDSAFALPGVLTNQDDIMNISVIFDLTAFIAAGKQFQFVPEDLLRMQDTSNGTWQNPGPKSTLPGKDRDT